jgi:hypothetical protein
MSIALQVAAAVLAKASAVDPTMPAPNQATQAAWAEHLYGVELHEALDAVADHYHENRQRIMPADLLTHVRAARREAAERAHTEEVLRPPTALPVGVDVPGRRLSPDLQAVHDEFNIRPCDRCQAPAGQRCRNADDTLTKIPHLARLKIKPAARPAGRRDPALAMSAAEQRDRDEVRAAANRVPCPHCAAKPGRTCVDDAGRTLTLVPAHGLRIRAAQARQETPA